MVSTQYIHFTIRYNLQSGIYNFTKTEKNIKVEVICHSDWNCNMEYGSVSLKYIQQSLQIYQNSFGIQIGKANGLSQINYKTNTKITCFSIRSGFSIIPYAISVIDSGVLGVPVHPLEFWGLEMKIERKVLLLAPLDLKS